MCVPFCLDTIMYPGSRPDNKETKQTHTIHLYFIYTCIIYYTMNMQHLSCDTDNSHMTSFHMFHISIGMHMYIHDTQSTFTGQYEYSTQCWGKRESKVIIARSNNTNKLEQATCYWQNRELWLCICIVHIHYVTLYSTCMMLPYVYMYSMMLPYVTYIQVLLVYDIHMYDT